jgi:hypothetical protein
VKKVDHWNDAEDGIEIKDGGAPLAIYYVPGDAYALYRWEESGENRPYPGGSLNGRANRSYKLYIVVEWRLTYIPCSKPVQVRFNEVDHVFPHEKLHFQVVPQIPSPKAATAARFYRTPFGFTIGEQSPFHALPPAPEFGVALPVMTNIAQFCVLECGTILVDRRSWL